MLAAPALPNEPITGKAVWGQVEDAHHIGASAPGEKCPWRVRPLALRADHTRFNKGETGSFDWNS